MHVVKKPGTAVVTDPAYDRSPAKARRVVAFASSVVHVG